MQAALEVAQANVAQAKADVVAGQAALEAQQAVVKDIVVSLYQQGSPELVALTGYLDAADAGRPDPQEEYADTRSRTRTALFDELHAAEVALRARRTRSRRPRRRPPTRRTGRPDLVDRAAAQGRGGPAANEALLAQDAVTLTVAARRRRSARPSGPGSGTSRSCAKLKKRGGADQAADPRRRRPPDHSHRLHRRRRRLPLSPGRRLGHLTVRLPDPPDLRLLGAARRHRLRRRLRRGHAGRRRRQGDLALLLLGLRQPALRQRRQGQRPQPHRRLQPRDRLPRRRRRQRRRAARPSATSARPAGPPAATCTSRCSRTAPRSTRWATCSLIVKAASVSNRRLAHRG